MLLAVLGAGWVSTALTVAQLGIVGWRSLVLVAVFLAVAGAAWRELAAMNGATRSRSLDFDGEHWSTDGRDSGHAAQAEVMLDLQQLILLRVVAPDRGPCWIWLDRWAAPTSWQALRRAASAHSP